LFVRRPGARFSFANFARSLLYSSLAALSIGMDILFDEGVRIDVLNAQGGLYKNSAAGQRFTAAALKAPVAVRDSAGEGGAWGMAALAAYLFHCDQPLAAFLEDIFKASDPEVAAPDEGDLIGFEAYKQAYKNGLAIENAAIQAY
jgi:sugar (pentulose or hexulose) kinase